MADNPNPSSPLPDVFSPATRDWFLRAFKQPTAVQSQTWHVAARGEHALVIAPTGSGKTLAAFLYALDRLFREGGEDTREAHKRKTSRILYISPIKALGTDVQRNLQIPLKGIADERRRRGETEVNLRVGIRTGDTPAQERSKLTRNPPDILITTPESLYLMLTSRARETLRGVETVIIDEVHAVAGSKRGAHLALSLERLDALLHTSAQRIGLSATVRSASDVAAFLGGDRPVTVVNPPAMRHPQIRIVVPVANMDDVSSVASGTGEDSHAGREGSIWPYIETGILDEVLRHRSTIVFTNSRGLAEKLTARLNELYAARLQRSPSIAADAAHFESTSGATSWRIQQITRDQVIVTPAPGRSARLPFWRGEGNGRPAELGEMIGDFLHLLADGAFFSGTIPPWLAEENTIANIQGLIDEQRNATGIVPGSRHLVLERCRDEIGDWRIILHSPYGRRVHEPWALAIAGRIHALWGADASVVASDDGIVARIPDTDGKLPDAAIFLFEPEKLLQIVREAVGSSALFAARFRECAARALLMPGRTPGHRTPLWQQRLRASQLLEIAQGYPDFPAILETLRECLQDVYDLPALERLMRRLNGGEIQISDVTTTTPSPFATSLLFGYVAEFMYQSDAPLAERRASVLSLDSELLRNLLGQVDPGELLDPQVIRQVEEELQRLAPGRRAKGEEGLFDLLRELGPMTVEDLAQRHTGSSEEIASYLENLLTVKRIFPTMISGQERLACMDDAARLRDALGVRLPESLPEIYLHRVSYPLRDLFLRYLRAHALVTAEQLAHEFSLGIAIVEEQLQQLREQGLVMNLQQDIWVSDEVFRRLRLRSLQAAREATRPVAATTYARLLLERQGVLPATDGSPALFASTSPGVYEGVDGVMRVIEQLAGVGLPASLWESQILPARVHDYSPEVLDELLATGAVIWSGQKKLGEDDGLVALHLQEYAAESFTPAEADQANRSALQQAIVAVLADGGAWFAQQISQRIRDKIGESVDPSALQEALWALVWQGVITSDIWAPLRALTRSSSNARTSTRRSHRARRGRPVYAQPVSPRVSYNTPNLAGRWSLLQVEPLNDTERMLALAENMLDRYGIISRQAVIAENIPGGFPSMQTLCRSMEDSGRIMRGRFVEGLGGAQFAERLTIDRLRDLATQAAQTRHYTPVALSANDPANVWGNLLPWPAHPATLVPTRRAGALVVVSGGKLLLYLAQGGKKMLVWQEKEELLAPEVFHALTTALRREPRLRFTLTEVNDLPVWQTPMFTLLREAGFSSSPQGLDWG
ncbi:ATP-dependent helicase [Escherichia coli]